MSLNVFEVFAKIGLDTSEYEKNLDKSKQQGMSFGTALKKGFSVATKAVAAVTTATTAMGAAFVKTTGDVAAYGDNIDKMSQKMGMSAQAYQEWDAVMQHSGTSMETLKASMKTLANAAETGNDAFQKLGITQEQISTMSQEELFSETITALQNIEDETQRTYLAGKTLGRGATELGALLNTSAEDTQAMKDRVHELGGVLSDEAVKASAAYQDSLQDMQTAMTGFKNSVVAEMLPSITSITDGLGNIFSGDFDKGLEQIEKGISDLSKNITKALPRIFKIGGAILSALGNSLLENIPQLTNVAIDVILQLVAGLIDALPRVAEAAIQIITTLANSLSQALPTLIPAVVQAVITIVTTLLQPENINMLVDAGIQLQLGLQQGIIDALPLLIDAIPQIIEGLVQAIITNAPKVLIAGGELIIQLITGIISMIPQLYMLMPDIIEGVVTGLLEGIPDMVDAGAELISSFFEGLISDNPIVNAFTEWFEEAKQRLAEFADFVSEWAYRVGETIESGVRAVLGDDWVDMMEDFGGDVYDFLHPDEDEPSKNGAQLFGEGLSSFVDNLAQYKNAQGGTTSTESGTVNAQMVVDGEVFGQLVYNYNNRQGEKVGTTITER